MPNIRARPTSQAPGDEWPLKWVVVALMALIAAVCWAFAAAGYAHHELGWRTGGVQGARERDKSQSGSSGTDDYFERASSRALTDFLNNAVEQIPHAGAVLGYAVRNSLWLVILFIVLEALPLVFWWKANALEKELAKDARKRRA